MLCLNIEKFPLLGESRQFSICCLPKSLKLVEDILTKAECCGSQRIGERWSYIRVIHYSKSFLYVGKYF